MRSTLRRREDATSGHPRAIAHAPSHGRSAFHDPRWPAVAGALARLREQGRRAVRIVDVDCGAGTLLLHALHHARTIGFVAIEGRGIDGAPALVGRARAAASRAPDPAVGVVFEVADLADSLGSEFDAPADILLWHGSRHRDRIDGVEDRLRMAANLVIGDHGALRAAGTPA